MVNAWEKGIENKTNPFDETIEQMWVRQWLFYSQFYQIFLCHDRRA